MALFFPHIIPCLRHPTVNSIHAHSPLLYIVYEPVCHVTSEAHRHSAAPTLAPHAADGSYPVHLVSEAATPRRGPPFLVSRFVPLGCGLVVKETSPHPSGLGVHA